MPYTMHIDSAINCVFYKFYGDYEMAARVQSIEDMFNHPDYRIGMNSLRDVTAQPAPPEISYRSITAELKRLLLKYDRQAGNSKWAVLVGDTHSYMKVHQAVATRRIGNYPVERKAFHQISEVKTWLDIPAGYQITYPD